MQTKHIPFKREPLSKLGLPKFSNDLLTQDWDAVRSDPRHQYITSLEPVQGEDGKWYLAEDDDTIIAGPFGDVEKAWNAIREIVIL